MSWVDRTLKVPDEGSWVALVEIKEDGSTEIIGYVDRLVLQTLVEASQYLSQVWNDYIRGEAQA